MCLRHVLSDIRIFSVNNDHAFFSTSTSASSFGNTQVYKGVIEYLRAKRVRALLVIRRSGT